MSTSPSASSSQSSSGYQSALSQSGSSTPLGRGETPKSAEATVAAAAARLREMHNSGQVPRLTPYEFPEKVKDLNQKIEHLKKTLNDKTKGKYTLESLEEAFQSIDKAYRIDKVAGKNGALRNSFKNLKTQFFAHKAEVESSQVKPSLEFSKREIKELISTANRFIRRIEKGEITDSQKIKNIEWLKELVRSCPDFVPKGLKAKIQGIDERLPLYYRMDVLKDEINDLQKNYNSFKDLGIFAKYRDVMWSFQQHINNRSFFKRLKDDIFGSKEITAYKELKEVYNRAFPAEKESVEKSSSQHMPSTSSDKKKELEKGKADALRALEGFKRETDITAKVSKGLDVIEKFLDCVHLAKNEGPEAQELSQLRVQISEMPGATELYDLALISYKDKKPEKYKEIFPDGGDLLPENTDHLKQIVQIKIQRSVLLDEVKSLIDRFRRNPSLKGLQEIFERKERLKLLKADLDSLQESNVDEIENVLSDLHAGLIKDVSKFWNKIESAIQKDKKSLSKYEELSRVTDIFNDLIEFAEDKSELERKRKPTDLPIYAAIDRLIQLEKLVKFQNTKIINEDAFLKLNDDLRLIKEFNVQNKLSFLGQQIGVGKEDPYEARINALIELKFKDLDLRDNREVYGGLPPKLSKEEIEGFDIDLDLIAPIPRSKINEQDSDAPPSIAAAAPAVPPTPTTASAAAAAPPGASASRTRAAPDGSLLQQVTKDENGFYLEALHTYPGDLFSGAAAPRIVVEKRTNDATGITLVNITRFPPEFKVQIRNQDLFSSGAKVIVNAANTGLNGGSGIDGAINNAGGREYERAHKETLRGKYSENARKWGYLSNFMTPDSTFKEGFAAMISSGNLKRNHRIDNVIVVAGPSSTTQSNKDDALYSCYYNSLVLAHSQGKTSIAFPSISTGIFGFPKDRAAQISLRAIYDFTKKFPMTQLKTISICIKGAAADSVLKSYEDLMDIM